MQCTIRRTTRDPGWMRSGNGEHRAEREITINDIGPTAKGRSWYQRKGKKEEEEQEDGGKTAHMHTRSNGNGRDTAKRRRNL
ncbi:hypothetical protein ZHAS_00003079 [Anopheles sinensis]|uniref:Uncharacterized protein n=1 Tax=Anopheles sinensis TaxID=74873 RepID=A0A084VDK3_ANOSI|nr:hypothetical protein ZHAS_00003079 [Anopheles sinensis]